MSVPPALKEEAKRRRPMKFVPNFALRDLFGWVVALALLATLAALFPWELGDKADPFAPAFKDIRPEWYFMFMFETLKLVPGGEILGVEYEAIPILAFSFAALLMMLVPFLDRGVERQGRSPIFTWIGVVALIYVVGLTSWGYRSLVPVYLVLGTGLLILLMSWSTRRAKKQ
jgi:cytochrome b6